MQQDDHDFAMPAEHTPAHRNHVIEALPMNEHQIALGNTAADRDAKQALFRHPQPSTNEAEAVDLVLKKCIGISKVAAAALPL